MSVHKDTNPKDAVGIAKTPVSVLPAPVIGELALALMEGARKYGRHNWRAAEARASVYYDAVWRHMAAWWEGEDIDQDSGLSHVTKAIASLTVLRDAMIQHKWVDDRPPNSMGGWLEELNEKAAGLIEKYPDAVEPWTASRMGVELIGERSGEQCSRCQGNIFYAEPGQRDVNSPLDTCICERK